MNSAADNPVYRKTEAGLEEMRVRRLGLPRKTFSLLLAVDGQRSRAQLCTSLSAFGDVAAQLRQLLEAGLIEDPQAALVGPAPVGSVGSVGSVAPVGPDAGAPDIASPAIASPAIASPAIAQAARGPAAAERAEPGAGLSRLRDLLATPLDEWSTTAIRARQTQSPADGAGPPPGPDASARPAHAERARAPVQDAVQALLRAQSVMTAELSHIDDRESNELHQAIERSLDADELRQLVPEYALILARHLTHDEFQRHMSTVLAAIDGQAPDVRPVGGEPVPSRPVETE